MKHLCSQPAAGLFAAALCAATLLCSCEDRADRTASTPAPDNSGVNARDRNSASPTPLDQGGSETDRRITADIRKAILAQDGVSVNGQNCKIITQQGVVTLRGPVASQAERDLIESKAKAVAGVTSVINEIEIAPR